MTSIRTDALVGSYLVTIQPDAYLKNAIDVGLLFLFALVMTQIVKMIRGR